MFTGIVTHRGTLISREDHGGDQRLAIKADPELMVEAGLGDSVAVNGVCLTMIDPQADGFSADVSVETLSKTTLGSLADGGAVNLELPVRLSDRLGGHMVSGHVDGKARLVTRAPDVRSERFEFEAPMELARYISTKGSVTLDGVSLTINSVTQNRFSVNLIPHTLQITSLGALRPDGLVNIEVDMIARYLERLVQGDPS